MPQSRRPVQSISELSFKGSRFSIRISEFLSFCLRAVLWGYWRTQAPSFSYFQFFFLSLLPASGLTFYFLSKLKESCSDSLPLSYYCSKTPWFKPSMTDFLKKSHFVPNGIYKMNVCFIQNSHSVKLSSKVYSSVTINIIMGSPNYYHSLISEYFHYPK